MIDAEHLSALILQADFTPTDLENICRQALGLEGERLEAVLGQSRDSWQYRIADLVNWSDRQGLLSELTGGVLYFGSQKRAVREWLLHGEAMPNDGQGNSNIERRVERLEQMLGDRLTYVERELQRLAIAVESRARADGTLNWIFVLMAILLALIVAAGTMAMAVLR
jgi:hypothetical protein